MKITTLVENTVRRPPLLAEHGLSVLVETREGKVLFDTGDGQVLLHNAAAMEVDLKQVRRVALSHGHHDHTGGLLRLLEHAGPCDLFAHPVSLEPKYSVRDGRTRSIGLPQTRERLESAGARFHIHDEPVEILPGVSTCGQVP